VTKGTLPYEKFMFYLKQDFFYLNEYSKVLKILSDKVKPEWEFFLETLYFEGLAMEQEMHKKYFNNKNKHVYDYFGISLTSRSYSAHLVAAALEEHPSVSVAALLPCFWIYLETGKFIAQHSSDDNPYSDWINVYNSKEYEKQVDNFKILTNEMAQQNKLYNEEKMLVYALLSARYEYAFWDHAYEMSYDLL
jgi:thiaminase/transcriptional activator TenA